MAKTTTNRYHFAFKMSGKDVQGKPIKDTASYYQTVSASTREIAEKRLRSNFFKSVTITITDCRVLPS